MKRKSSASDVMGHTRRISIDLLAVAIVSIVAVSCTSGSESISFGQEIRKGTISISFNKVDQAKSSGGFMPVGSVQLYGNLKNLGKSDFALSRIMPSQKRKTGVTSQLVSHQELGIVIQPGKSISFDFPIVCEDDQIQFSLLITNKSGPAIEVGPFRLPRCR